MENNSEYAPETKVKFDSEVAISYMEEYLHRTRLHAPEQVVKFTGNMITTLQSTENTKLRAHIALAKAYIHNSAKLYGTSFELNEKDVIIHLSIFKKLVKDFGIEETATLSNFFILYLALSKEYEPMLPKSASVKFFKSKILSVREKYLEYYNFIKIKKHFENEYL